MNNKAKFWLLFFVGVSIYLPFFWLFIIFQMPLAAILSFGGFSVYCYGFYRYINKKVEPRYPLVPPEGRMTDHYFPRTKIPRPIYEDVRRYPEFFKRKKMKRWERRKKVKKNS